MVANPARDQRTPSQSHSSGSYPETGMGSAERLDRNGWEPFDYLKVLPIKNPLEKYENNKSDFGCATQPVHDRLFTPDNNCNHKKTHKYRRNICT